MLTIKPKDWQMLRPHLPYKAIVYRNEKPIGQVYDKEPKVIKEHTGKVVGICICLLSGKILSLAKGIHSTVCNHYGIDLKDIEKSGWKLDNGNYVWR